MRVSLEKPRGVGNARKNRRSEMRPGLEALRVFDAEIGERIRAEFPAFVDELQVFLIHVLSQ
jgi:hypothetical protein